MRKLLFLISVSLLVCLPAMAQRDRISGQIDRRRVVALRGNVHPKAQARFDQGPADPSTHMSLLTLVLKPSPSQQAALDQLLADQQNPASSNYHRWLTPEEYADRFGASRADIAKITAWLESEGFAVDDTARGRNWIVFHGTAAQVQSAFHTEIHHYRVQGELHFANASEPSVPAAIEPLVTGILGLNDFKPRTRTKAKPLSANPSSNSPAPDYTSSVGSHYLAPDDLATIYDIKPLYSAGIDGTGQKIVIVGQSDINVSDIHTFRSNYNLPAKDPQVILVPGSKDPGTNSGDMGEADLDLEWSGAVARNAAIIYVNSTNVFNSAIYAISQNLAPVISFSFGACEAEETASSAATGRQVAQEGAAQGITWLASSGDSGAAGCDPAFSSANAAATYGLSVNFPASIPEVTAVGGTQFNEGNGSYWNTSNSTTSSSALSYIPEAAWNESSSSGLAATGGGSSILFSKPSWQTGPGVPTANARAVPDTSLSAAEHDAYLGFSGGSAMVFSGTSAAAPATAGIIALLNQYQTAHGGTSGQGNINPTLYNLAQVTTGVFHDITSGNNIVPCTSSTTGCSSGSYGYSTGSGYDMVTGLGSLDANNFVTQWTKGAVSPAPVTLQQPYHLQPFSGDVQAAAAGSVLPQPIVVSALDANGAPISGVTVTFSVPLGGGSVSPASAVTNVAGLAQTQMTLGPASGTQMVLASANQFASTGIPEIAGTTPSLGLGYLQTGNNQTAKISTALPTPLTLTVADSNGTILPDVPVTWLVTAGGGTVQALAALTDSSGKVSANWILGSTVGTQTVQAIPFYFNGASRYGYHGATFTAIAQSTSTYTPVQPFQLQPYSGDVQLGTAGSPLPKPVVVVAKDANGIPLPGIAVSFSVTLGGGSVSPTSAVTDPNGLAQTQMTLGPTQGAQMVLASGNEIASTGVMEFAGTGVNLKYSTGSTSGQTAPAGTQLLTPLTLTITDSSNRALPSIPVAWLVTAGGGSVTALAAVTDSNGNISANWTLGTSIGTQTVQAIPYYYNGTSMYGFHGMQFTATAQAATNNPVPTLTSLSPASATAGGAAFTLTVSGTNFISSSVVQWNGTNRTTTFLSASQLTASISATDIASAGSAQVTVVNPSPGGGTSAAVSFSISTGANPVPTLASISPSSTPAGGAAFTLAVSGTNFNSLSIVQWNGSKRTTTIVSATQLMANIPATDIASAGTAQVTVVNPAPGGGTSSALTFTIGTPLPTIASGGVLSNASYAKPPVLAPGMLVEVFGTALTDGTTAFTPSSTLPTRLAGARLLVNGVPAGLSYASPTDIKGQLPVEIAGTTTATVQVEVQTASGTLTGPSITLPVASFAPGIFTWDFTGSGPGAILRNSDYGKICPAGRADCPANAAARGDVIVIFMTGLGQVNGSWVTGQPNPQALSTTTTPLVTIGGVPANVEASVLAVGFPGLYQVNVDVPPTAPTGDSVPVVVSMGGVNSNSVTIAVK